jgi:hypothetical protein
MHGFLLNVVHLIAHDGFLMIDYLNKQIQDKSIEIIQSL